MAKQIKQQISIEASKKTGAINVAATEMQKFGDKAQAAGAKTKTTTSALGGLTSAFGGLIAGASVIQFFKSAVSAAIKQEDAVNKLNTALRIQGNFTAAASRELQEYASALQKTTRFGDETILGTQALLASFGIQGEELKKTTQATLDLATATGTDLNAAALLLAKAFKGETGSLSRYGIILDENTPKSEKFSAAIAEINKNFGGSAQADAKTFGGAMAQLGNTLGDVGEEIGKGLIPAITNFGDSTKDSIPFITNFGLAIAGIVGTAITGIKSVVDILTQAVSASVSIMEAGIGVITSSFTAVVEIVRALLSGNISEASAALGNLGNSISGIASKAKTDIAAAGSKVVEDATKNSESLKATWAGTFGEIAGMHQEHIDGKKERETASNEEEKAAAAELAQHKLAVNDELAQKFLESQEVKEVDLRAALDAEIEAARAVGLEKIQIKRDGVTQEIAIEQFRQQQIEIIKKKESLAIDAEDKKIALGQAKQAKDEETLRKAKISGTKNALSAISALQNSKSKELVIIGKAAAAANIIINTAQGISAAWKLGPILGPILAPLVAVAGAAQLAAVAGVQLQEGGVTTGTGPEGILANIGEKGRAEAVIPLEDPQALKQVGDAISSAAGGGGAGGVTVNITNNFILPGLEAMRDPAVAREVMEIMAAQMEEATPEAVVAARRTSDLAELNEGRAV